MKPSRFWRETFWFLTLALVAIQALAAGPDVFEQIAQRPDAAVPGIVPNPPPQLPEKSLPWDKQVGPGFQPGEKLETQAQLDAELQRMRTAYAPFMAELAPPLRATRPRIKLENFDWRLASVDDLQDLARVFAGKGAWEQVTLPHYRGPINEATAFYRTTFRLDSAWLAAEAMFIHFQAVDYVAEAYVNGRRAGGHEGLFAPFELDIRPFVKSGENVLVVVVRNEPVMMGDFMNPGPGRQFGKKIAACGGPGWDEPGKGWHMCPPGFGVWQPCWLEARPATFIRDVFVRPLPQRNAAEVWVEVAGATNGVTLAYSLHGQNFQMSLARDQAVPGLSKFTVPIPESQLRWWSPDEPWLYQIQIELKREGAPVDAVKRAFGMRTFVQSVESEPKGRFYMNGKEVRLRGANMMGNLMQCVMRGDTNQLRDDILLAKIANLNFWRMTQQPCPEEVYDYFDRLGLLAQTDLPVFNGIRRDQAEAAYLQLQEMVRLVRGHPCNALISYNNEPDFKKPMMLDRQGHEQLFRRFDEAAQALNPGQVTKWVEGDYVNLSLGYPDHHDYGIWYGNDIRLVYQGGWHDTRAGWMYGCGEFGAEGLDSVALMQKHYPQSWLEATPDGQWTPARIPRCQSSTTGAKWFSPRPMNLNEWVERSRDHQYWGVRLMTESLRRMPKMNSFAVHLLIDAWPAGWLKALVDCDRQAKPAYFAYREALTPLAVNLQPDQFYGFGGDPLRLRAWVLNDTQRASEGARLCYQVESAGKVIGTGSAPATVLACEPVFQGNLRITLPEVTTRQTVRVRLGLVDSADKPLHDTFVDLEVFPAFDKGGKLNRPGGQAQRIVGPKA